MRADASGTTDPCQATAQHQQTNRSAQPINSRRRSPRPTALPCSLPVRPNASLGHKGENRARTQQSMDYQTPGGVVMLSSKVPPRVHPPRTPGTQVRLRSGTPFSPPPSLRFLGVFGSHRGSLRVGIGAPRCASVHRIDFDGSLGGLMPRTHLRALFGSSGGQDEP